MTPGAGGRGTGSERGALALASPVLSTCAGAALAWAVASRRPNEGEEAAAASKTSAASGSERRVAVFCGSSLPSGPRGEAIKKAAVALGEAIPAEGMEMVFGGGNIGLMGTIARAVDRAGGRITGVIPRTLAAREVSGKPVQQENEIITETMHERKMLMASMSAGFIAMPGGFGTLEELFEAVTWTQLNIHSKPVGLLNVGGFYDPLVAQVRAAAERLRAEAACGPAAQPLHAPRAAHSHARCFDGGIAWVPPRCSPSAPPPPLPRLRSTEASPLPAALCLRRSTSPWRRASSSRRCATSSWWTPTPSRSSAS